MAATPSLGDWFDRLGAAGLRAGVRERLLANALLLRLAVQGRLPADRVERLRLIGPLVCGSPQQQRDYARLVDEVARAGAGGAAMEAGGGQRAGETGDAQRGWVNRIGWIALVLALALLCAVDWQTFGGKFFGGDESTAQAPAASQPGSAASGVIETDNTNTPAPDLGASAIPQPVYVPQRPLQWALPTLPAWAAPLRWSLAALGGLALVFLVWRLWRHWQRRRPYLEAAYTDRDPVEERLLRDAEQEVAPVGPGPAVLMPVTRALRQRMDGGRAVLDVRATIAATIRQGGRALQPVMRAAQETPEYLALVERASSDDHQARYHEAVVQALQERGVVVELFFYAHSPQYGVWRLGRAAEAGGMRPVQDRVSFASLQVRYARHRLLVFGDARSALDPDTGEVQPWASAARHHFVQRAWFTPLPVANWARAEAWVAETAGLDFLLLPMEDAALTTLADWLGSGRARLVQHPQAPFRFPPLIKGQELDWAVRRVAPPDDVLAQLLHELRGYLGPKRMQWLAACAVFPALAWPLTLALGRKLIEDDGERAVGLAALGALPWFRQGRMPGWLREALLAEMDEARLADLRKQVLARLDKAVAPTAADEGGEVLARISRTHAPVRHWLTGRRGQARDLLLVRFLEPALAPRLVQRLPEVFRRGLFRHGSALLGLRGWVELAAAVPLLAGVAALPGVWSRVEPGMEMNAVAAQQWPVGAGTGAIKALGVSADGWLVCTRSADDAVRRWRAATGEAVTGDGWCAETMEPIRAKRADGQPIAAISTDGERILTVDSTGRLEVRASLSGDLVAAVNAPTLAGGEIQARFAADGSALFAAGKDGQVHRWGAAPPQAVAVLGCATTEAVPRVDAAARVLADRLANPKADDKLPALGPVAYTPAMWQTLGHGTAQQVPAHREILMPANAPDVMTTAMQTLAAWLSQQTPTMAAWTVRTSDAALSMPTLGTCEPTSVVPEQKPPEPQLEPVAWPQVAVDAARGSQLQAALNAMFSTNRASRVQATQKVITDADLVSDLLPMALQRAQARGSFDETLTLVQAAMPVTVQRQAAEIYRLLGSLPAETDVGALRQKLLAVKGQRPKIFLKVAEESQRAEAVKLQVRLRKLGFDAPRVDKMAGDKVPEQTELRVWGRSDQALARWLAIAMVGIRAESIPGQKIIDNFLPGSTFSTIVALARTIMAVGVPKVTMISAMQPVQLVDTYELWLPKSNDQTVMTPGTRFRDCEDAACPWMVVVPAGSFMMGSPASEPDRGSDEGPQHRVSISKFAIGQYEVTQGQWKALMGSNPSGFKDCGDDCPVENVSWDDAQAYVKKLSEKTGQKYRLPSEAEWEYAARAGTTTAYAFGATLSASQANFDDFKIGKTVAVGRYAANKFGLSDMHGNVWEWVQDCWHDTYANAPINGEAWETECNEAHRVLRGGSWNYYPRNLRSANRLRDSPDSRDGYSGFRIAKTF